MSPVAAVTGAGGGIGAAIFSLLEERGWTVIGLDREWREGEPERAITVDLADTEAVGRALDDLDRLDGLVNNAAVSYGQRLVDSGREQWADTLAVNLTAPFELMKAAIPHFADRGGAIVNVSSVHAHATSSGNAAYAAAKGGLTALTRSAAVELGPLGIRVNAVLPGAVDTDMLLPGTGGLERERGIERLSEKTPLRRVAAPIEVAEAVAFLLDGRASFITGECLLVDGGALSCLATE